jgi:hypothetical protein
VVAGCGVGGNSASSQPTAMPSAAPPSNNQSGPDACGLVSQAQASNVVGGVQLTKVSGTGSGAGSPATCVYSSITTGAYFALTTGLVQNGASLDAIKQALNTPSFQSVGGIGEEAGEAKDPNFVKIAFVKGNVIVILTTASPTVSGESLAANLEILAKSIAAKV